MVNLFYLHVQKLINEALFDVFLLPSISLSSELFLNEPLEEVVEVLLCGLWHHLQPDNTVQLDHKCEVVWDYINCSVDGVLVLFVFLDDGLIEGDLGVGTAELVDYPKARVFD